MTLAGSLHATCDGRPYRIEADGHSLVIRLDRWRDGWALRRSRRGLAALAPLLAWNGIELRAKIRNGRAWRLAPPRGRLSAWLLGR